LGYGCAGYGTANLVDAKWFSIDELVIHFDKHQVSEGELREYLKGSDHRYAWVLEGAKAFRFRIEIEC